MFAPPGSGGPATGGAAQSRQSGVMQPMADVSGLVDFDSDYESDEGQGPAPTTQQPVPGVSGGQPPSDRALVGGFAAAAYEAAKAHHYAQKNKKKNAPMPKRSGQAQR